jgi:O-antigen ligase
MRTKIAILACLCIISGLVLSKFMITVGMVLLFANAIFTTEIKEKFQTLLSNKAYWSSIGIYLLFLLSGIYTENWNNMFPMLRIALPYLLLPIAFAFGPDLNDKNYKTILYFFVTLMFLSSIYVLINYLLNFDYFQQNLAVSKTIFTPQKDHIRYSLLLCLSIFSAVWLIQQSYVLLYKWEKWLLVFIGIFLFIMLHILSVRSGILAFYLGVFIYIWKIILVEKRKILGIVLLSMMLTLPYLAFVSLPSFRQKFYLMRYNWEQYQKGEVANLSDTQRLLSYQIALKVANQNPWIGVGLGDLEDEQTKIYEKDYKDIKPMQPHNQFLSIFASCGIIGLLFFLACFLFPLFYQRNYQSTWFLLFYVLLLSSFLTENTIFVSIGIGIHSFFMLLFLHVYDKRKVCER